MAAATESKGKNGTVEVLRFFFAICIVGVHLSTLAGWEHFQYGHYGVEFFFIISGLLMAQSIERKLDLMRSEPGKSTFEMVFRKAKRLYPYVIIATVLYVLLYTVEYRGGNLYALLQDLVNLVPYMFFANMTGIGSETAMYMRILWWVAAMFIAMMVLAPLYIRFNDYSKHVLFPLLGLFVLGVLILSTGTITQSFEDPWGIRLGVLRAIGEMALGAVCYNAAMFLKERYTLTSLGRVAVLSVEVICFVLICAYVEGSYMYDSSSSVLFLMMILTVLVYSDLTWNLKSGRFVSFLGNISLPMYLTHIVVIMSLGQWMGYGWVYEHIPAVFILILVLTVTAYAFVEYALPRLSPVKKLFVEKD